MGSAKKWRNDAQNIVQKFKWELTPGTVGASHLKGGGSAPKMGFFAIISIPINLRHMLIE